MSHARTLCARFIVVAALILIPAACSPSTATSPDGDPQVTITPATDTYYVSPAGSDTNPGTADAPWRTLGAALPRLQPGQLLFVRGGTYTENVKPSIRPGRADARVTVAAYPGERPVVEGLLWLSSPSYWTLRGINVTWNAANPSTSHMVKMTNGVGWVIEDAELWGARSYAALLVVGSAAGQPADWTVRNNCVHDTYASNSGSQDHNLYINTGASAGAGLIERNVLFNAPNGENVKLGYGRSTAMPGDGTANVTVRYNTMYGALKNLMVTDESHHNVIERNIVVGASSGQSIRAYRLTDTTNVFRDNVFYGATRLQYADPGYQLVADGGGNRFPLDPQLDAAGCGAFQAANPEAQAYGRHAP